MKKILLALLAVPAIVFGQTYPSPTFSSLTLQNPLTAANGGTGANSSTGTGSVVLSSSPTISSPTLSGPTITGSLTATGLVTMSALASQAANTVVANATASSASPAAVSVPSCSTSASALKWTSGSGFGCNTAINAATLNGTTFSAPGAIGGTTPGTAAFTTMTATGSAGASSLSVSGSSTATSVLSSITDTISGTITNSFRPDTFFISRTYNGAESSSGYTSGGDVLHPYLAYGTTNTSTSGSVALVGGNINIYNSSNGPAGRSEFTPLAVAAVPIKGGTFSAGSNYYNDFNIQSAPGTGGQEGFLASGSFAAQKWTTGNTIDANHAGSYGLSVITTPNNTGYDSQTHTSDTTYPLNAMVALVGWSGVQSTTSTNGGATAAATPGANVGLQIGGPGGSVWGCATCYSYFPIGINIQDYTTSAINISAPNSAHTTSGTAINIASGAGNLVVGDSIYVGTTSGGGLVQMGQANIDALTASTQALIHFQDRGTDKWLIGKQSDNSFVMFDNANSAGFFTVSTAGLVTVGEGKGVQLNPTTFANLTTCGSGAGAGTIAYITDASAAITAWHQQVTAGGGANKAFVACNGSGWYAFDY